MEGWPSLRSNESIVMSSKVTGLVRWLSTCPRFSSGLQDQSSSKTFSQSDQMFLSLRMVTWSINLVATSSKSLLPYPTQGKIGGWIISRCHCYIWREIICSWVVEMDYAQFYASEEGSRRRHRDKTTEIEPKTQQHHIQ
ncbi:hypothetical protein DY000_02050556 [Brassica cretica]|uniref:Uncharacterized protein n=1 Tax=Brassica cretica TaxID=69181 RepID=A0ABQ7FAA1_BRACR|nr:hypothetical protein DY000_02050556 [Brassica cretica]